MKAAEIVTSLRRHYGCEHDNIGPEWASLTEVELYAGPSPRIDLLLVRAWSGKPKGHERHAVEIKVSRADLRRELESAKWEPWAEHVHRFYLAVPAGLNLDGLDLPDRWGIYTVSDRGVSQGRRAPRLDAPADLPHRLFVEAFRRASRAEARIRQAAAGGDRQDPAAELAALRRQVTSLERRVFTAEQAKSREEDRVRRAFEIVAQLHPDGVACQCGTPIRPRKGRYGSVAWDHLGEPGLEQHPAWRDVADPPACTYPSPDLDRLLDGELGETA